MDFPQSFLDGEFELEVWPDDLENSSQTIDDNTLPPTINETLPSEFSQEYFIAEAPTEYTRTSLPLGIKVKCCCIGVAIVICLAIMTLIVDPFPDQTSVDDYPYYPYPIHPLTSEGGLPEYSSDISGSNMTIVEIYQDSSLPTFLQTRPTSNLYVVVTVVLFFTCCCGIMAGLLLRRIHK